MRAQAKRLCQGLCSEIDSIRAGILIGLLHTRCSHFLLGNVLFLSFSRIRTIRVFVVVVLVMIVVLRVVLRIRSRLLRFLSDRVADSLSDQLVVARLAELRLGFDCSLEALKRLAIALNLKQRDS